MMNIFKKKKTYVILALIILIVGGIYYWKSKPAKIIYTTETAEVGTLAKTVSATGEVVAENKADLSFKFGGQIKAIFVEVGDVVKKGAKIATIDQGTLWSELSSAKNYLQAQRDILYDMKKRDETYNEYQRDTQRALIKKAQDAVNVILTQVGQTTIYSPMAGIVTNKNVETGENVSANETVLTISTTGEINIEIDVPESDIVDVKIGQKAKLTFDALSSDEILEGEVSEIYPAATVIQDVVYYKVKIKLSSLDERLKIGMSVDSDINVAQKDNVVMIPARAVKSEGGQEYVEVLEGEKDVKKVNVKSGFKGDEGMIEIISGLQGGENVVVLSTEK
jgi:RND family efflux transporter MFP subunit